MKIKDIILILCLLVFSNCTFNNTHGLTDKDEYNNFKLTYSSAGLGSGMGSMQPTFRVTGIDYIYTYEQNSFLGEPDKQPDTIFIGTLRTTSIDSIGDLVKDIQDSVVYRTTLGVMSGGIQHIWVT